MVIRQLEDLPFHIKSYFLDVAFQIVREIFVWLKRAILSGLFVGRWPKYFFILGRLEDTDDLIDSRTLVQWVAEEMVTKSSCIYRYR